jgi:2,4-dienoyl-CoA reductase-like NADH-dependent reductase (Old Yellow Enzyme family)/thioredoxin reductase
MKTAYGTTSGRVTDRLVGYFRRRAEGEVGLIISEPLYVHRRGTEHPKQLGIDAGDKVDGLRSLVEAIHGAGTKVFAHLNHGGRAANPKAAGGPPLAPSRVPCKRTGFDPEELTEGQIAEIVFAFSDAAVRAKETGFDGVELQFGLGYLVSQFLSPTANLRTDGYGGDTQGRRRFAEEVFLSVRESLGEDFPICVRVSGSEKAPGGLEIGDALDLVRRLEELGADLIHVVTGSNCESLPWYFQHMALPPGVNEDLASKIRAEVGIPVMAAGRLGDPNRIREIIGAGITDMVALGRPLLADPDLPKKMKEGRDDEVLLCGHCLQGCFVKVKEGVGIGCNVNPLVGHEREEIPPAEGPKHVAIVGGGPAGIRAALTAHSRGHKVTLFEKNTLGGQFALACLSPSKERMSYPLRSLVAQLMRSGIDIQLGREATRERLSGLSPDVVILATGSRPSVPDVPGLDDPITGEEILTETRQAGDRVLVLGGGMVGMEVAEFLGKRGKEVAVVEMLEEVARDMDPISLKMTLKRFESLPIPIHTSTRALSFENGNTLVAKQGERHDLGRFDSVVVTVGNHPHDPLSHELREAGFEVEVVGDAEKPGKLYDAVNSGHAAGVAV